MDRRRKIRAAGFCANILCWICGYLFLMVFRIPRHLQDLILALCSEIQQYCCWSVALRACLWKLGYYIHQNYANPSPMTDHLSLEYSLYLGKESSQHVVIVVLCNNCHHAVDQHTASKHCVSLHLPGPPLTTDKLECCGKSDNPYQHTWLLNGLENSQYPVSGCFLTLNQLQSKQSTGL